VPHFRARRMRIARIDLVPKVTVTTGRERLCLAWRAAPL
jgi:hypothetical protein